MANTIQWVQEGKKKVMVISVKWDKKNLDKVVPFLYIQV